MNVAEGISGHTRMDPLQLWKVSVQDPAVLVRHAGNVWQRSGAGLCSFAGIAGISATNYRMKLPATMLSPKHKQFA
jgi:hypothetical protein